MNGSIVRVLERLEETDIWKKEVGKIKKAYGYYGRKTKRQVRG